MTVTLEETLERTPLFEWTDVPVHVGFQRRFDVGYRRGRESVVSGELGTIHAVRASTHDQAPPPPGYIRISGGPVTFCEVFPPADFPLHFYRYPVAPDPLLIVVDVPMDVVRDARVFWATVTGLSQEPSRGTNFAAWEARDRQRPTILDLDCRLTFWSDPTQASEQVGKAWAT